MIVAGLVAALALASADVHLENKGVRLPVPAPTPPAKDSAECVFAARADVRAVVLVRAADEPDPAALAAFREQLAARCVKLTEPTVAAADARAWARERGHTHVLEVSFQARPVAQGKMAGTKVTRFELSSTARLVALDGRVLAYAIEHEGILGPTLPKAFVSRATLRKGQALGIEKAANRVADAWFADVMPPASSTPGATKEAR